MLVLDLSRLPAPLALETLDYEAVLAALVSDFTSRWPEFTAALESEPVIKLLEIAAWRETLLRARVNDAYKNGTLAFAVGADLDHIGAFHGVARKTDDQDTDYRARIQQAYWRLAASGPASAFVAHALEASPDCHDARAWSDGLGRAACAVLAKSSQQESALDDAALEIARALTNYAFPSAPAPASGYVYAQSAMLDAPMQAVRLRLLSDDVLPLGMELSVRPAEIVPYAITARLILLPGPDANTVRNEAAARLDEYLARIARLGYDAPRAGLHAALFAPGVMNVALDAPASDVVCTPGQIAVPTSISITIEEVRDV